MEELLGQREERRRKKVVHPMHEDSPKILSLNTIHN